jgi:hypothetical protein
MRYTTEAIGQKIRATWREDLPRHESLWPESPIDGERFPLLAGLTGCSTSGDYLRFLPRDREVRFDEPQTLGSPRAPHNERTPPSSTFKAVALARAARHHHDEAAREGKG